MASQENGGQTVPGNLSVFGNTDIHGDVNVGGSLPLPTGAATESTQSDIRTLLSPSSSGPTNLTKTVPTGSAQQIAVVPTPSTRDVLVCADSQNTATVYVGGSGVTTSNGVELTPGDSRFYQVNDASLIYCISTQASQILRIEVL